MQNDPEKLIETGRQVLATEAHALAHFAETLGETFAAAVTLMLAARGRVIVVQQTGSRFTLRTGKKLATVTAAMGKRDE